jgi:hypothetical protein
VILALAFGISGLAFEKSLGCDVRLFNVYLAITAWFFAIPFYLFVYEITFANVYLTDTLDFLW